MIDRDHVIAMLDGDAEMADRFIQAFKSMAREQLPELERLLLSEDYPGLSNAAHVMKSQTGYVGLQTLSALSEKIEMLAKERSDSDTLTSLVKALTTQLTEILKT